MDWSVIPEYVTPEMVPVSPALALMRIPRMISDEFACVGWILLLPLTELFTTELENVTELTVLSERPPTLPMDRP